MKAEEGEAEKRPHPFDDIGLAEPKVFNEKWPLDEAFPVDFCMERDAQRGQVKVWCELDKLGTAIYGDLSTCFLPLPFTVRATSNYVGIVESKDCTRNFDRIMAYHGMPVYPVFTPPMILLMAARPYEFQKFPAEYYENVHHFDEVMSTRAVLKTYIQFKFYWTCTRYGKYEGETTKEYLERSERHKGRIAWALEPLNEDISKARAAMCASIDALAEPPELRSRRDNRYRQKYALEDAFIGAISQIFFTYTLRIINAYEKFIARAFFLAATHYNFFRSRPNLPPIDLVPNSKRAQIINDEYNCARNLSILQRADHEALVKDKKATGPYVPQHDLKALKALQASHRTRHLQSKQFTLECYLALRTEDAFRNLDNPDHKQNAENQQNAQNTIQIPSGPFTRRQAPAPVPVPVASSSSANQNEEDEYIFVSDAELLDDDII
jgi:hypothetical protein